MFSAVPERTRLQPRRTSALSYGARDVGDRTYSRSPRNLVVLLPPADLPLNQDQLGNVLSMGPRHRLSQGILIPLFPSMLGQMHAIAREYNFPSTVGLCLHLHINENAMVMTPRISDDSWQCLFGHLFDGRPHSGGQQLPISASIEFDIDLNKARWFDAWVSGSLRDPEPVVSSRTSSGAHWPAESRVYERPVDDHWNPSRSHTLVTNSQPETLRHLPKKLSLVDRLESHGVHVPPKSQDHPDRPDSLPSHGTYASSPILQVPLAFPQVTEYDLEHCVNSWRATTELHPPSMVETYQPATDVGVPTGATTMDECALEHSFQQAVDVDEFLWSVLSVGPQSPVMEPSMALSRPTSIHLDRSASGTAPPTSVTITSWGPADDECQSVASSITRLPSPDIGERVIEDGILPRHPAVWGNSFGWRSAMTWKQVYPYPSIQAEPTIRVQLQDPSGIVPHHPHLMIYPTVASQSTQSSPREPVWGSSFGWNRTWRKVYPYATAMMQSLAPVQLCGAGGLVSQYPNLSIYPAVYPNFEIYPTRTTGGNLSQSVPVTPDEASSCLARYPSMVIYPAVYPHFDIYPPVFESVKAKEWNPVDANIYPPDGMSTLYPNLVIYHAVYPHFDLYPKALVIETPMREVGAKLMNTGHPTAEDPNMTIYPGAHPYLEIYPRDMQFSGVTWGVSFGWLTAKTWLQVYPLHTTASLAKKRRSSGQSISMSRSGSESAENADITVRKQSVWGASFGSLSATTWRAVWPTPYAQIHPDVSSINVPLGQQNDPSRTDIARMESQLTQEHRFTVSLIPHYPNLVIYPPVYPHFDLYPASLVPVERGKAESNLRRRRIDMWRARTAAQVGLAELLANKHNWEVDEPLRLDLADYTWSQTSAGPYTSPIGLCDVPSLPGSVHIDRRMQGSVLRTPSTTTTWGPQDDGWYSETDSIERLPSPDLGRRVLDDVENIEVPHQPWHMVWPFFDNAKSISEPSALVAGYPHLTIHPPAYPHFELYPTRTNVSTTSENQLTKTLTNSNTYPVRDICPAVYPHFDIYPIVDSQIEIPRKIVSDAWHERVEVKLASLYPNFDIYPACYPYNLDYIYPCTHATESTQMSVETSRGYSWPVVDSPVYPFIIPYSDLSTEICQPLPEQPPAFPPTDWELVCLRLPVWYPLFDLYPASYPWSLESIYPAVSLEETSEVSRLRYPCCTYPPVQPYSTVSDSVRIPRELDEGEYKSANASPALLELKPITMSLGPARYPHFDLYPAPTGDLAALPSETQSVTRRQRKTHMELHASVFRSLEKRRARSLKTHQELHNAVFQDGVVWTPSGYAQDLSSLITRRRAVIPVPESQPRRPSQENSTPRPSRSRPATITVQSPDKVVFPLGQPPAVPPISPLRIRSPGIPSQPSPAVSEVPIPRVSSPPRMNTHMRTTSARLSQAVRAMMPGGHRRSSSAIPESPPPEHRKERAKSPTRFLPLVDRRSTVVPPLPNAGNASEFLTRAPRNMQIQEGLVLKRARAIEQSSAANPSSGTVGTNGAHPTFVLPPLPSMTGISEAIERPKTGLV